MAPFNEAAAQGVDGRRHPRVQSQLRCWCEGDAVTVYARVGNLSEGGLFLRTKTPLPRGVRARVRLTDGGDVRPVDAAATVVWTRSDETSGPSGMGLEFEPLDGAALTLLRRLLRRETLRNSLGGSVESGVRAG